MKLHDSAIVKLTNTQTQQGQLLQTLSDKQDSLENHMLNLCRHLSVPPPPPRPLNSNSTPEDMEMTPADQTQDGNSQNNNSHAPNPSQGAPEGTAP